MVNLLRFTTRSSKSYTNLHELMIKIFLLKYTLILLSMILIQVEHMRFVVSGCLFLVH